MSHSESNIDVVYLGRYNPGENTTGPEKAARNIFTEHAKKNRAIFIEYFFDGRKYNIFKKLFGKETEAIDNNTKVYRLGLMRVIPHLISFKPKSIHIITYERFAVIALLYKLFSKTKVIYNIHGIILHENITLKSVNPFYKWKDKVCEKLFFKYSDKLIFPSQQAVMKAKEYFDFDTNNVSVIPHGTGSNNRVRTKNETLTGTIAVNKIGFSNTIGFLNNILEKIEFKFILNIIGGSPNIINNDKLKVIHKPILTEEEFQKLLLKTDIFFSINQYDTFSIAALEAMSAGCCVIATKETGMSVYIKHGINGFYVGFGDSESTKKIIDELNSDTELRNKISTEAKKITNELNWVNVYQEYLQVYENI